MATIYKTLGQVAPSATTNQNLYTVPALTSAVTSTLSVCNRSSISTTFRVAVRPAGAALSNEHYVMYDITINGNDSLFFTLGLTLATTDVITVSAGSTNLSFNLYGSEIA